MKRFFLLVLFTLWCLSSFSQTEPALDGGGAHKETQGNVIKEGSRNKKPELGCTLFGGLGGGGNNKVSGFGSGAGVRAHYGFHTVSINVFSTNRLEYHGNESSSPTLHSTCAGFAYGAGLYEGPISVSVTAGLGYSSVTMSTGGGASYWSKTYNKYGGNVGMQFSVHGKYVGFGLQFYSNITSGGIDSAYLLGIEVGLFNSAKQ